MTLKDEAAQCLRSEARPVPALELAKLVVASAPTKYRDKLERSNCLHTYAELYEQVRREIAADHARLLARYPEITSEKKGRTRLYEWRDS